MILADWTAPVGAIGSVVAAVAALVAIIFAKQAAVAAQRTVSESHALRVEEDFRQFRAALWALHEAADNDRREGFSTLSRDVLQAQTRLKGVFGMRTWIILTKDAVSRLYIALDGHSTPIDVYSAAGALFADLDEAWDARAAAAVAQ